MRRRVLVTTLVVTLLGLVIFALVTANVSYRTLIDNTRGIVTAQIRALDAQDTGAADKAAADALSVKLGGLRVTFMDADGAVTGDSFGVAAGESRADREEVAAAMESGTGSSTRRSDSTGTDMLYVCRRMEDGSLVRLGIATESQWDAVVDTLPTLAGFIALDIVVCLVFSYFATNYALKPVEELARQSRGTAPLSTKYRELYPITEILNKKNEEIRNQLNVIGEEQQRVTRAQGASPTIELTTRPGRQHGHSSRGPPHQDLRNR